MGCGNCNRGKFLPKFADVIITMNSPSKPAATTNSSTAILSSSGRTPTSAHQEPEEMCCGYLPRNRPAGGITISLHSCSSRSTSSCFHLPGTHKNPTRHASPPRNEPIRTCIPRGLVEEMQRAMKSSSTEHLSSSPSSNGVSDLSRFVTLFLMRSGWPCRVKSSLQRQFLEARTSGKSESGIVRSKTLSGMRTSPLHLGLPCAHLGD